MERCGVCKRRSARAREHPAKLGVGGGARGPRPDLNSVAMADLQPGAPWTQRGVPCGERGPSRDCGPDVATRDRWVRGVT